MARNKSLGSPFIFILVAVILVHLFVGLAFSQENKEAAPSAEVEIVFDVYTADKKEVEIEACVTYHEASAYEGVLSPEEAADRAFSNVLIALRLAAAKTPFKRLRDVWLKDYTWGEAERFIESSNVSPHEVIKVDKVLFNLNFDGGTLNNLPIFDEEEGDEEGLCPGPSRDQQI